MAAAAPHLGDGPMSDPYYRSGNGPTVTGTSRRAIGGLHKTGHRQLRHIGNIGVVEMTAPAHRQRRRSFADKRHVSRPPLHAPRP